MDEAQVAPQLDGDQEPAGRRVDPRRVLARVQELDGGLVQRAVLQIVVEDQEAEIAALRAELVKATGGGETATRS